MDDRRASSSTSAPSTPSSGFAELRRIALGSLGFLPFSLSFSGETFNPPSTPSVRQFTASIVAVSIFFM
jgi:hypothetical protein